MRKRVAVFFVVALVSMFGTAACGGGGGDQQLQEQVNKRVNQFQKQVKQLQQQVNQLQKEQTGGGETTVGQ